MFRLKFPIATLIVYHGFRPENYSIVTSRFVNNLKTFKDDQKSLLFWQPVILNY